MSDPELGKEETGTDSLSRIVAYIKKNGPQTGVQLSAWGVDQKIEQRYFHNCLDRGVLVLDKDLKFSLPIGTEVVCLSSPDITPFTDYQRWVDRVVSGDWSWVRNTRCKYVNIHLDTRREGYTFTDRDGNPITFAQLCWQYSKDTPTPP